MNRWHTRGRTVVVSRSGGRRMKIICLQIYEMIRKQGAHSLADH